MHCSKNLSIVTKEIICNCRDDGGNGSSNKKDYCGIEAPPDKKSWVLDDDDAFEMFMKKFSTKNEVIDSSDHEKLMLAINVCFEDKLNDHQANALKHLSIKAVEACIL
jgi:hypothetical protein